MLIQFPRSKHKFPLIHGGLKKGKSVKIDEQAILMMFWLLSTDFFNNSTKIQQGIFHLLLHNSN